MECSTDSMNDIVQLTNELLINTNNIVHRERFAKVTTFPVKWIGWY